MVARKKILIVNNNLHIGGVQKALLNLLREAAPYYDITLLLFYKGGEWLEDIPEQIKVITPNSNFQYYGLTKYDAKNIREKLARVFWALMTRLVGRKWTSRCMGVFQKKLDGYDVAVSFLHSGNEHTFYGGCNEFVLQCVDARKKITFLHCDYEKIKADSKYNREIYRKFDVIAACSRGCRKAFLNVMPQYASKTVVVENCHNYEEIKHLAYCESVVFSEDKIHIVSVARFGKEKGILRAILAIAKLGEQAKKIRYYVIGTGAEFSKAKSLICEKGIEDTVILVGEKKNPYGYMQAADLLLIPSRSEAAPMVIGESASLGTPILMTRTSSAQEMVEESGFGWVCNNSVLGIEEGIRAVLMEPEKLYDRREFLKAQKFDNHNAIEQFAKVVCSSEEN